MSNNLSDGFLSIIGNNHSIKTWLNIIEMKDDEDL